MEILEFINAEFCLLQKKLNLITQIRIRNDKMKWISIIIEKLPIEMFFFFLIEF